MQIAHSGKLVIELETCGEPLIVHVNSSSYREEMECKGAVSVLTTVGIAQEMYEVVVSFPAGIEPKYTPFRILANGTNSNTEKPLASPGNDGTILWFQISAHRVEFHWSAPVSNTTAVYRVFYTYEERERLQSACGIGLEELMGVVKQADLPSLIAQTTFRLYQETSQPVHFTVLAYIGDLEVPYSPITVQLAVSTSVPWLLLVLLGVFGVCLAVGIWKWASKWQGIRLRKVATVNQSVLEQLAKVKSRYGELGEE